MDTAINYNYNPNFGSRAFTNSLVSAEQSIRGIEYAGRKVINKFSDIFIKEKNPELYDRFLKTDTNSDEYIKLAGDISRKFSTKKVVEINIEDGGIEEIAKSGKPHIFMMNHDDQKQDPQMLALFNTLLNEEYIRTGQASSCPRPKLILNEDILDSMNKRKRSIMEKLGAVPIDASIHQSNKKANAVTFTKILRGFIDGKSNVFIFPEGRMSIIKNLPLVDKFQTGVAEMVTTLSNILGEVRVTPLGFAYGKNENSLHIGKTVLFKKDGKEMKSGIGNVVSDFAQSGYKKFFDGKAEATITDGGVPVVGCEQSKYVGGILCENLRICIEEAKRALQKTNPNEVIREY